MSAETILNHFTSAGLTYNEASGTHAWREICHSYSVYPDYEMIASTFSSDANQTKEEFLQKAIPSLIKVLETQIESIRAEIRYLQELQHTIPNDPA